eukprot:357001-Chlamydomonas_euryale.AAC.7
MAHHFVFEGNTTSECMILHGVTGVDCACMWQQGQHAEAVSMHKDAGIGHVPTPFDCLRLPHIDSYRSCYGSRLALPPRSSEKCSLSNCHKHRCCQPEIFD